MLDEIFLKKEFKNLFRKKNKFCIARLVNV